MIKEAFNKMMEKKIGETITESGNSANSYSDFGGAVRPALWVDISNLE